MPPHLRTLLALLTLAGVIGCGAAESRPPREAPAEGRQSTPASPEDAPGTAPTVLVELQLVEMMFVEGGYGVVAISNRASGDELARAAVQLGDSGSVVLPVVAGELDVRAWTHACDPSGCSELSDTELDTLRPGSDDLCTTSVTVPGTAEPSQTQLLYQFGVLAPDDTRATCRLEVLPGP